MTQASHSNDTDVPDSASLSGEYIIIELRGEVYGLTVHAVREIRAWSKMTVLPDAPEFVLGIIDLRGQVVPIYDLQKRFSQDEVVISPTTVVVVVQVHDGLLGIVVDRVTDIQTIDAAQVKPIPHTSERTLHPRTLRWVVNLNDTLIGLINLDVLFEQ